MKIKNGVFKRRFVGVWYFNYGACGSILGIKKEPYSAQRWLFIEVDCDDFEVVLEICRAGIERRLYMCSSYYENWNFNLVCGWNRYALYGSATHFLKCKTPPLGCIIYEFKCYFLIFEIAFFCIQQRQKIRLFGFRSVGSISEGLQNHCSKNRTLKLH